MFDFFYLIPIVIFVLALVQSLFGVGLLLFGTPLLLALSLSYEQTLLWLLPASACLSWSQVLEMRHEELTHDYRSRFFRLCIPLLLLAMLISFQFQWLLPIKWLVLIMLCLSIVLRLQPFWFAEFKHFLTRHLNLGLGAIGIIHGLSNMGGSVLTILAAGIYDEKRKVLAAISLDYAFMASAQLILLLVFKPLLWQNQYLLGSALALLARYLIGQNLFVLTHEKIYQHLLTGVLILNAGLLGWTLVT